MNVHSLSAEQRSEKRMTNRQSRKKETTARRQQEILKAALEVFVKKGFAAATIPEIARGAGIAAGTIYLYYPSKRDLFAAVIENIVATPLLKIFEKNLEQEFPQTIKEAIADRFRLLQGNIGSFLAPLMAEIQREPELRAYFVEKVIRPFMSQMEALYRIRIETGEFRRTDPAIVVRMIGGLVVGMNLLGLMEGPESPLNLQTSEQLSNEVMNFILYGLMNKQEKENGIKSNQPEKRQL
jgi:AcrR family transcriptional regulator